LDHIVDLLAGIPPRATTPAMEGLTDLDPNRSGQVIDQGPELAPVAIESAR